MKLIDLLEAEKRSLLTIRKARYPDPYLKDLDVSIKELTSLEGAPKTVHGHFVCYSNRLSSLDGVPHIIIGDLNCFDNQFTSLKGIAKQIKRISGYANFEKNPITSHVLGLLQIEELKWVALDNRAVQNILNKHLKGDRDIFACQEELIEAGFPDFAKL